MCSFCVPASVFVTSLLYVCHYLWIFFHIQPSQRRNLLPCLFIGPFFSSFIVFTKLDLCVCALARASAYRLLVVAFLNYVFFVLSTNFFVLHDLMALLLSLLHAALQVEWARPNNRER